MATILAEMTSCVFGVDPDRDRVQVAVIDSVTRGVLGSESFPNNPQGHDQSMEWADGFAAADERVWAVEGSGSYGARITRSLQGCGEWVVEFSFPKGPAAPDGEKSDYLDAVRAGREVLGRTRQVAPRQTSSGGHSSIRALTAARAGLVRSRTALVNNLKATLRVAPETLISDLGELNTPALIKRCAGLRPSPTSGPCCEVASTKAALRALARPIQELDTQISELTAAMTAHVNFVAPALLAEPGVGPVSASQILVSWGHRGRLHSEAAFAKLSGTAPIDATSGQNQTRRRLSRGGDRALNQAIHTIALTRSRHDPATKAYINRRCAEGKTKREAQRCIKRYIARHIYRTLENPPNTP